MYEQQLPNYTDAFKTASWQMHESEHYRFHYFKESLAEKEIEKIVEIQEKSFQQILAFLKLPSPDKKLIYYLYPDDTTKEKLMGSPWFAQSIYNEFAIHALYTEKDRVVGPHEDTHLLSLPLGLSIGFLQEGLAELMVGHDWYGNPFQDTVREVLTESKFKITADLLVNHQAWLDTDDEYARQYYALSALFSDYIINQYRKDSYFMLYKSLSRDTLPTENDSQYLNIFGINSKELFDSFLVRIKGSSI